MALRLIEIVLKQTDAEALRDLLKDHTVLEHRRSGFGQVPTLGSKGNQPKPDNIRLQASGSGTAATFLR